ncbi:plasmid transfer protein TraA [Streptomyces sp. NPDC090054]|uniref:plasmid transfer protein TraA n=1 Tax=Streptomyces sp. NPDC090054 TaxID=3365933 RepID=UPI00380DF4A9
MTTPAPNNGLRAVPPRPRHDPDGSRLPARDRQVNNKLNVKFSPDGLLPPLALHLTKTTVVNGGGTQADTTKSAPGSDFTSNEDIHAYANHGRKLYRDRACLTAMDAEALVAILRHIPDTSGSFAGARIRAAKVSRPLKRIAALEKTIAKLYVVLYAGFQREFEAELNKVGKARAQKAPRAPFSWS